MQRFFLVWIMTLVIGTFVCAGGNSASAADEYDYDLVHSSISFKARHLDISWIHGRFNEVAGKFSIDREDAAKSTFSLTIKTDSVDTANEARDEHLRQPDYFDTKQFPTIEFKSTKTKAIDGGYEVTGDFTMHGATKEITLVLMGGKEHDFKGTKRVAFSTELSLKRSDYGFDKNAIGPIGDEALIIIDCEGVRKELMPEPLLYLEAMGAAAIVSAMFVLAMAGFRQPASTALLNSARLNSACVLGMGLGLAIGYYVLSLRVAWPPANGLDRFLTIVVPAALTIEMIVGFQRVPRRAAWLLRMCLFAMVPRILLHDSIFLSGSGSDGTPWQVGTALAVCGGLLAGLWGLLAWLSERSPGFSIPLALSLSTQCAGLTVMMAGYIKGGAAAFPLAATLVATAIGAKLIAKRSGAHASFASPAILGIGVVGLFGLLFIGRFFGRVSTGCALATLLAPLLCWATETPLLRNRKPWLVGSLRLVLVAIPLVVVLTVAKRDFDRDMAPLLSTGITPALPRRDGVNVFVRWPSKALLKQSTALDGHRTEFTSIATSTSLLDNPSPDCGRTIVRRKEEMSC